MGDPYKPRKRYCRPLSLFSSACHPSIAPPPRWSTPLEGLRLPQLSRVRAPFVVPLWRVCVAQLPLYSARGPCGGEGHAPRATPARLKRPCNLRVPLSRLPPPPPPANHKRSPSAEGPSDRPFSAPAGKGAWVFQPMAVGGPRGSGWPRSGAARVGGAGRTRPFPRRPPLDESIIDNRPTPLSMFSWGYYVSTVKSRTGQDRFYHKVSLFYISIQTLVFSFLSYPFRVSGGQR